MLQLMSGSLALFLWSLGKFYKALTYVVRSTDSATGCASCNLLLTSNLILEAASAKVWKGILCRGGFVGCCLCPSTVSNDRNGITWLACPLADLAVELFVA